MFHFDFNKRNLWLLLSGSNFISTSNLGIHRQVVPDASIICYILVKLFNLTGRLDAVDKFLFKLKIRVFLFVFGDPRKNLKSVEPSDTRPKKLELKKAKPDPTRPRIAGFGSSFFMVQVPDLPPQCAYFDRKTQQRLNQVNNGKRILLIFQPLK